MTESQFWSYLVEMAWTLFGDGADDELTPQERIEWANKLKYILNYHDLLKNHQSKQLNAGIPNPLENEYIISG